MRVFVAIGVEEQMRNLLLHQQQRIRRASVSGKFTSVSNFHLTLEFIGEITIQDLPRIIEALAGVVSSGFNVTCDSLGKFDRAGRQIWWVGIQRNRELNQLQQSVRSQLRLHSVHTDAGTYIPHITLAREVRVPTAIAEKLIRTPITPFSFTVDRLYLMESTRHNGVLIYKSMYELLLN